MSADENFSLLAWKTTISDMLAMSDIEWGMGVQVKKIIDSTDEGGVTVNFSWLNFSFNFKTESKKMKKNFKKIWKKFFLIFKFFLDFFKFFVFSIFRDFREKIKILSLLVIFCQLLIETNQNPFPTST